MINFIYILLSLIILIEIIFIGYFSYKMRSLVNKLESPDIDEIDIDRELNPFSIFLKK